MAKGVFVEVRGLDAIVKKLKSMPKEVEKEADVMMHAAANDYVNRAVATVPVDQGLIKQGISAKKLGVMNYEVVSAAPYSAYVEFGTRKKTKIPSDLTEVAAKFKGKSPMGGDYYDFLNAILDWVKRKGIVSRYSLKTKKEIKKYSKDDNERLIEAAQAIALSILRNGIKAQPFFFQHRQVVFEQLKKDLQQSVSKAVKK